MAIILPMSDGPKKTLCSVCKKRTATRLCDFPIGTSRYVGHPPRGQMREAKKHSVAWKKVEMSKTITCDKPLCDKCAIKVHENFDLCPSCRAKILEK